MKRILLILSLFYTLSYSHTLVMNVQKNDDNTINVEGAYSTGDSAAGAMIRLESLNSGAILYKQRLPYESELTIEIPKEDYQIVLDGGPGHVLIEAGIAPKEGFIKNQEKMNNKNTKNTLSLAQNTSYEWANTTVFLFTLCLILLILAIYFSFRNTNKILKMIGENNS